MAPWWFWLSWAVVLGFVLTLARLWRRKRRRSAAVIAPLLLVALAVVLFFTWYYHRPAPVGIERQTLFEGITYSRETHTSPRPFVAHIVRIDLDAPGIAFKITPPQPTHGHDVKAQTVSQFLQKHDLQLAINGGFFDPWHSTWLLDYYPHVGDPVSPRGVVASEGAEYGERDGHPTLMISSDNRATIGKAADTLHNALSCGPILVVDGQVVPDMSRLVQCDKPHPRTAAAIDRSGRVLILFVIDGRQPGYSEGITLPELARFIIAHGGWRAMNLDGGGSSTLVIEDDAGRPRILNWPVHGRIPPGLERPVATQIGIYAQRSPP